MKAPSNDQKRVGRILFVESGGTFIRTITLAMFVLISSILIVGFPSASCGANDPLSPEERAWLKEHDGKIIVNNEAGWPPIIDTDKDGNPFGIVVDYQRLIEKKLNFKFKMDRLDTWHNFMERFSKGEIDVNNNLQKNPERTEYALFTKPYIEIPNVIIVRKENKASLSLDKMRGMKIAVTNDFAIHNYIKNNYDYLQLMPLNNDFACLLEVSTKNVDAAVVNLAVASFIIEKMGIANLRIAGQAEYTNALCFASRKDWPVLNRILEKGLNLVTPAERDAIYKKWISLEYMPFYKTSDFWIIIFSVMTIFFLIISMILVWNRSLKRQVGLRTEKLEAINIDLKNEIDYRKQAEEALKESENKYRLLADNANDVIFVLDMNLNYTYISPSVKILRGYEPEEALKLPSSETLTPSSWNLARKVLSEFMELEKSEHPDIPISRTLQLEVNRKDGTTVWTEMKFSFIRNEDQQPVGILGLTRDITERKQAEEKIYRANAFLDSIVENIPNLLFLKDARSLRFVRFNRAGEDLLGYSRSDMLGKNDYDFFPKEQADHFTKKDREVLHGKEVVDIPEEPLQTRNKGERTMHTKKVPLLNMNGEPEYLLGISEDITEQKRAEKQLQQTLESLRKAVSATIQVMVSAVEIRDPYTAGHQLRVADLARTIATEMGLPQDKIEGIGMAGSIHDIGKLSIPAEILSRPAKLTNIEFSMIKEHSQSGYEMLKNVESPWPLAQIVYQHHERMNGTGYPRNLKGNEILMEARIMAVADVVEAMASHRPYRAALAIEVALEEIEKNKGIIYDADVADACLKLFREKGYQLK